MNVVHEKQELIERYLYGELQETDRIAFEASMLEDQELWQEVELMRDVLDAFQYKGEQDAINVMKQVSSEKEIRTIITGGRGKYRPARKTMKWIISLASAAIVAGLIFTGIRPEYSSRQLFDDYYLVLPYEPLPSRGGGVFDEVQEKQLTIAADCYGKGDYTGALHAFGQISMSMQKEDIPGEIFFYTGICMIQTGNENEAIRIFRNLSSSGDSEYRDDASWYQALAYLKEGKRSDAERILSEMTRKENAYSEKSKELLMHLRERKWL